MHFYASVMVYVNVQEVVVCAELTLKIMEELVWGLHIAMRSSVSDQLGKITIPNIRNSESNFRANFKLALC